MKRLLLLLTALPLLASAEAVTVSAAASLTDAFKEIAPRFEATRPGVTVRFNFAASGVLLQQIAHGAPVDVFASADQETMNRAAEQKLIAADTRRDFAANALVLVTTAASPVKAMQDLAQPAVKRIAVGKVASVPVGRYTQQALENAQLWAPLSPKLVFADNVRQVLDYVSRGEVEAGFVYRTDAKLAKGKVVMAMTVGGHAPITYPAAVVVDSRQAALARDFVAFLGRAEAQAILVKYGFGKP
ncbi:MULTISPECIES: molybdate ABC transporter substrate-binding protein [unclassified Roseateles]|uniref:molybdate ABC transporter substrate-binding protein n=1 Tax=unclassified Roseateles TaxID=2626991 RepID=UPI0006F46A69|nr:MULTISPECIES: molybdate ABC transporter substrate-binding protein [unclassified Roseateles]KQW42285.1 molybdate ABC transporter substrate-binding protein [Pelomonas sp. Root405]KRA68159.1 molybdate ABC transporter substrate-binding protein [Pelomonas sp. Root662]